MAKALSRPTRWANAVASAQEALGQLDNALTDLRDLREEYEEWGEGMPENLQDSPTKERIDELVSDADSWFDDLESAKDSAESALEDISGAELPRGFGRD